MGIGLGGVVTTSIIQDTKKHTAENEDTAILNTWGETLVILIYTQDAATKVSLIPADV